jgi:hypothetical protein
MSKVFLVGFALDAMKDYANKIGGYFEKGIYADRFMGIEAESDTDAIKIFLEKRKSWIRAEEKKFVKVIDQTDLNTWQTEYYRSENAWDKSKGLNIFN